MTAPDRPALLRAVQRDRGDDTVRLAFADHLGETGECPPCDACGGRGEIDYWRQTERCSQCRGSGRSPDPNVRWERMIRLAVKLADGTFAPAYRPAARLEVKNLARSLCADPTDDPIASAHWHRGFVASMTCVRSRLVRHAPHHADHLAVVRDVRLDDAQPLPFRGDRGDAWGWCRCPDDVFLLTPAEEVDDPDEQDIPAGIWDELGKTVRCDHGTGDGIWLVYPTPSTARDALRRGAARWCRRLSNRDAT